MRKNRLQTTLVRESPYHLKIENPYGVPAVLLANEDVPVEAEGVEQLLGFLEIQRTIDRLAEGERAGKLTFWGDEPGALEQVTVTPDFHKGGGIPVGTVARTDGIVIPQAVGNDVCCGMRLLVLEGVKPSDLDPHWPAIQKTLRAVFFEGKRDIAMSPELRRIMLTGGPRRFHEALRGSPNRDIGLWKYYDFDREERHLAGWDVDSTFNYDDYIRSGGASDSRDNQIGSVGGGNHFVEIQMIDEVYANPAGWEWGIRKGAVAIMAHTGSVGLGHAVGGYFNDQAKRIFPAGIAHPDNGFYFIPTRGVHAALAKKYLDAMHNAANFAAVNRICLGLMAIRALTEVLGKRIEYRVVGELPHNLIWSLGGEKYLHRKGACPATSDVGVHPDRFHGDPVIIPGSMGSHSFLLEGLGKAEFLSSACHGAGRSIPRGRMHGISEEDYRAETQKLRIVTPIDPESPMVRNRRDVLQKYHSAVKEESPSAYKPILPVIETVEAAQVASKVARMWPLLTVKG